MASLFFKVKSKVADPLVALPSIASSHFEKSVIGFIIGTTELFTVTVEETTGHTPVAGKL
jgi:hypothetical protein